MNHHVYSSAALKVYALRMLSAVSIKYTSYVYNVILNGPKTPFQKLYSYIQR